MIQAIADQLAGLESHVPADAFTEPLRSAYTAVLDASPGNRQQALIRSLINCPERDSLIGAVLAAAPGDRLNFLSLAEIADDLPPITWFWSDWIPNGMITLLGSAPGIGKSFFALDLARRVIHGMAFPDGSATPRPGAAVIYVDAELVPQMISERAERWGMDTSRLYLLHPEERSFIDFSQQLDRDRLIEMACTLDPALIVVDSLSSISSRGENSVEDVRDLLGFLNNLALDVQSALLLIHHLRKRGPLESRDSLTIDDFRGSSHIIAMARSVLGLSVVQTGPEPDRNGPRRLEVVKSNLARYPEPIGVEFLPLHPTGVLLEYGDPPGAYESPTKVDLCGGWLLETLEERGEPMRPRDIVSLATEAGFSRSTLYRARSDLGNAIVDTEGHQHPGNQWALP
jgi:hypothetical protein